MNEKLELIKKQIIQVSQEIFSNSFKFRPHQLEAILIIIYKNLSNDVNYQIMNAPTGSGKSIIGIIAAKVLWKFYNKKSYILVSDLSLFDQYVHDINKYQIEDIGYLKGKDNYICKKNCQKVNCSICSLNKIPLLKLINSNYVTGYKCKDTCEYIQNYKKAINSPITLLTYQLYLIQRNYVADDLCDGKNKNFPERDLIICDEAHKLCDIIQTHFSPIIDVERPQWMQILDEYCSIHNIKVPYESNRQLIINNFIKEEDKNNIFSLIKQYEQYLYFYLNINEKIRDEASKYTKKKTFHKYLVAGNLAREIHCKFDDMIKFINELNNTDYLVKSMTNENITINFIFENVMIQKYFHNKSKNELLMSATIGEYNTYLDMIGLENAQTTFLNISSTFDYKKSPIYISLENKMSWKEKSNSIKNITRQIIDLCNKYSNQKGIIQTGNYENAKYLFDNIENIFNGRLIFYFTSKEKNNALKKFKESSNGILIGPTLLEGLNFPGDECRFLICMKLPYANLANKLVEAKKNLIPNWYTYDVMTKLEQGFGRGIRFNGDWCINYVLDGCISDLLKYNKFNKNIEERIIKSI